MNAPSQQLKKWKKQWKEQWRLAFFATLIIGLLVHMPILLSDIPNHDGLDSLYFDQNMITSGRWFLTVACGFSSYYTLPWLIGILGITFLAATSVALTELLEVKNPLFIVLISGLLVSFPALASTFAYVYTLDGYMMALFFAVLAVLLTKKFRLGFLCGALLLACSLGTYQAYLPFAVILSMYEVVCIFSEQGTFGGKIKKGLPYLYMGALGAALYYGILQFLLAIQGKELASYQGINTMAGQANSGGFLAQIFHIYRDFVAFTLKGHVVFNNLFSEIAILILAVVTICSLISACGKRKWWKHPVFFVMLLLCAIGFPAATNLILLISPQVTYHLLIRYQWILYPILMLTFSERYLFREGRAERCEEGPDKGPDKVPVEGPTDLRKSLCEWGAVLAAGVLIFNYAVTDNIAYSNLQKRYEKTYAYCLRLLDRVEQTPGYYQGIPVAMIGVVGDEQYPITDLTGPVTAPMIGMNGDVLLYTGANYKAFIKNYLGASLNILEPEAMSEIYYSEEYRQMESFPGSTSTKVVDGILYVKTENVDR